LAPARQGGLLVISPEQGWPAALVAADCVVADHGSVSLYAAALDRPLLLAPFGDEVVPGTALHALGALAPRLDPARSLLDQITVAIDAHTPGRYDPAAGRAFAVAPLARGLRSVLYELVDLDEPAGEPAVPGWPPPRVSAEPVTAHAVYTRTVAGGEVLVRRIPAAVDAPATGSGGGWVRHLAVDDREWDLRMVHSAAVYLRREPGTAQAATRWAREALTRLPGARIACAATGTGFVAAIHDGRLVDVSTVDGMSDVLGPAAVYGLWHADALTDGRTRVYAGATSATVQVRVS
jgi:hypothetical protein